MNYRKLERNEIEKLDEIDRSELVEYNYRCKDGKLELFEYFCDIKGFGEDQLKNLKKDLYLLFDRGGTIFGAFDGLMLIGIASLDSVFRGKNKDKLQMALLHVSNGYRKKGIGKTLVGMIKEKAQNLGAKSLYVSCAPIKNTIDFYYANGCKITDELEKDLFELEPEDIHMVMLL